MSGAKNIFLIFALLLVFTGGIFIGFGISFNYQKELYMPSANQKHIQQISYTLPQKEQNIKSVLPKDSAGPKDRIKESDINIYRKRITIDIENPIIAKFTDTKSMEPVLDNNSNAIEVIPKSPADIKVGDIISYRSPLSEGTIIHRIVEKDIDKKGIYFIAKGDNLKHPDPGKIRFHQIRRVLVGILY